ncbi:c-type cytochrome [Mucilaginibacter antarcticus]
MLYQQMCASCHGDNLKGTDKGANLLAAQLKHGATKAMLMAVITNGVLDKGMPAWNGAISKPQIAKIADYIIAKRRVSLRN